jgi:hypothetical protein
VTKGDPSDGDYDPIARYEQGAMIVAVIFADLCFDRLAGLDDFMTSNYRGNCRSPRLLPQTMRKAIFRWWPSRFINGHGASLLTIVSQDKTYT